MMHALSSSINCGSQMILLYLFFFAMNINLLWRMISFCNNFAIEEWCRHIIQFRSWPLISILWDGLILCFTYITVPSSAALQNIKGILGAVASRFTLPAWQLNTCVRVESRALMSWTRILQSAAPVTTIESLELGRNWNKTECLIIV